MKLFRTLVRSTPLLLACSIAGAVTTWSPIACSCLSAWEDIASGLNRPDLKRAHQLTARVIAESLSAKFSGRKVNAKDLPFSTSTSDCAESNAPTRTVRCRWWLWEAGTNKKGYDVIIYTAQHGIFQRVSVLPVVYVNASEPSSATISSKPR
jgi:hypothetical protein